MKAKNAKVCVSSYGGRLKVTLTLDPEDIIENTPSYERETYHAILRGMAADLSGREVSLDIREPKAKTLADEALEAMEEIKEKYPDVELGALLSEAEAKAS